MLRRFHAGSLATALLLWLAVGASVWADDTGVLILAHGGNDAWNASVREAVAAAHLPYPTEIALGMGMHPHEVARISEAIARLRARGVTELLVVPLLVSSHSDVYRQYKYLLGLRRESPWPGHASPPLPLQMPVRMTAPLEGHAVVAEIVLERARHLSAQPAQEIVVLVAHGPNSDADNEAWLRTMRGIAGAVQAHGHFARVEASTLRDDASWLVRARATRGLRRTVAHASRAHRVLVVPLLMAQGGIEQKIPRRLRGLSYSYSGETLLPHPGMATWIRETVEQSTSAAQPAQLQRVGAGSGT